jgi:hypothetical protein
MVHTAFMEKSKCKEADREVKKKMRKYGIIK